MDIMNHLFGGGAALIRLLIFTIVLDVATGLMKSFSKKTKMNFKSRTNLVGLMKKFGMICAVMISAVVDQLAVHFGTPLNITFWFTLALIINEALSVCENLTVLGVDLGPVSRALEVFKEKDKTEATRREEE
ncbi:phage holin family protein [Listeria seeligeri]|uniref:phage holin family protein n=1 Tax=Listeria seeligeri TaxID=1640 RepID=UPI0022EA4C8E|nr:phage holin family protein [Listeria seeligeri]